MTYWKSDVVLNKCLEDNRDLLEEDYIEEVRRFVKGKGNPKVGYAAFGEEGLSTLVMNLMIDPDYINTTRPNEDPQKLPRELIRMKEAAGYLGISKPKLYRLTKRERLLPYIQYGGRGELLFERENVLAFRAIRTTIPDFL